MEAEMIDAFWAKVRREQLTTAAAAATCFIQCLDNNCIISMHTVVPQSSAIEHAIAAMAASGLASFELRCE